MMYVALVHPKSINQKMVVALACISCLQLNTNSEYTDFYFSICKSLESRKFTSVNTFLSHVFRLFCPIFCHTFFMLFLSKTIKINLLVFLTKSSLLLYLTQICGHFPSCFLLNCIQF